MTQTDLFISMLQHKPSLEIKDILDFVQFETPEWKKEREYWEVVENEKPLFDLTKTQQFVNYNTKKDINQAIRNTNRMIDLLVIKNRKQKSDFNQIQIGRWLKRKEKLQKKLAIFDKLKVEGFGKEAAKLVPIDNFMEFNGAGFTKCIFHSEKTPSLHKIPNTNTVWCFSCNKRFDVIDVVMKLNNYSFNEAIKVILQK